MGDAPLQVFVSALKIINNKEKFEAISVLILSSNNARTVRKSTQFLSVSVHTFYNYSYVCRLFFFLLRSISIAHITRVIPQIFFVYLFSTVNDSFMRRIFIVMSHNVNE